jgi:hypothetical protein
MHAAVAACLSARSRNRKASFGFHLEEARAIMKRILGVSLLCTALSACAADPSVRPVLIRAGTDIRNDQFDSYALQQSIAVIRENTTGEGANRRTTLVSSYERRDHPGLRIALVASDPIGVRTQLTIKRYDNTDIPEVVTVGVEDNRVALINQVGGFIGTVVGAAVGFSGSSDATFPLRINLSEALGTTANPDAHTVHNTDLRYQILFEEVSPDATPTAHMPLGQAGPWFFYAACRTAHVELFRNGEPHRFTFRVSDPNFLQRARLPYKGTITMHSQCGASVAGQMEGDGAGSAISIAAALVAQAQAIRDAADPEE